MSQSLAKDFNFRSLLKFAFPSIIMMIFMSLYSIVDGFFIAQYVDSMALSAANIVYPAVSILLAASCSVPEAAPLSPQRSDRENWRKPTVTFLPLPLPH